MMLKQSLLKDQILDKNYFYLRSSTYLLLVIKFFPIKYIF